MEDILRVLTQSLRMLENVKVLILILMEDILRDFVTLDANSYDGS